MRQYEIWWAELPSSAGIRPVLLLSRDSAYEYLNKVLAVEITTTVRGIAQEVRLGKAEGMLKPCVANFDNVRTVSRSSLVKRAGSIGHSREGEVKLALGRALNWVELF